MQTCCVGIDNLQGDKESFYGDLLPTLYAIKAELEECSELEILGNMSKVLVTKLVEKRFVNEFELHGKAKMAICAAISHPAYKAKWGTVQESEKALIVFKQEFEEIAAQIASESTASQASPNTATATGSQQKFIRLRPSSLSNEVSELNRYLSSERVDLQMLDDFPVIREMFFKFNTQLPTSATVERMFNFAGILDNPKRGRTLPTNFENNILLKANDVFGRDK